MPLIALVLLGYVHREEVFGVDVPVRVVAAIVLVILGWRLARDVGRSLAPPLFRRMDPAKAGTVGFLIRLVFLVLVVLAAARIAGLDPGRSRFPAPSPRSCSASRRSRRSAT